jgi:hypothetical protein
MSNRRAVMLPERKSFEINDMPVAAGQFDTWNPMD